MNRAATPGDLPASAEPPAAQPGLRAVTWNAGLGVLALGVAAALQLWRIAGADHGVPLWDPAEHGVAGVALADALRRGDVGGFLLGINRQVLWPFAHSLMLLPWALAFGGDYASAARLSAVIFAGAVLALFAAGTGLHPVRGAWVGAAASALMLLAPIARVFGSVCMLEMPGALLLALTVSLHVRACREPAPRALLIAAGVSSAALFFCKYNYGLLWLAPLALHEWWALPKDQRAAGWTRARRWFATRQWLRPFPVFMALFALAIAAIAVTGGGVFTVAGTQVSVRSPGNPLYGFYLVTLAWLADRVRRAGGVRAVAGRLAPRHRILLATVALPIAVWFLIPAPNRFRVFFDFVVNRETAHPLLSIERWLDYPRVFAHDYSPAPWVGWLVLALALVPPPRVGEGRDARALVYRALWVGFAATAAHHYHQPRFLFTVAPLVWLAAAMTAVSWLDVGLGAKPALLRRLAWSASLAGLLAWAALGTPPAAATAAGRGYLSSPPALAAVVDRVLDLSERSDKAPWLLGYANELSPALLRWQALLTHPRLPEHRLPGHPPAVAPEAGEAAIAGRIEAMRASGRPVLVALGTEGWADRADYRLETRADSLTAARLAADPRVIVESDSVLAAAGFRVSAYRFAGPGGHP
jgi:hypothetical protein